ncbi:hypothetical protein D3C72_2321580 [compost metagenome]
MLSAINEARKAGLPDVVVVLQDAIGCISTMQKDSAVLDLLVMSLQNRAENSRIIGRDRGKVFKQDHEVQYGG